MAIFTQLEVSIGGYFGGHYSIEKIDENTLRYDVVLNGDYTSQEIIISEAEWLLFFNKLEKIGVKKWLPLYKDFFSELIMDGTSWHCEIITPSWKIVSGGSNCEPDNFSKFLKAIRQLIKNDFK